MVLAITTRQMTWISEDKQLDPLALTCPARARKPQIVIFLRSQFSPVLFDGGFTGDV